MSITNRLKDDLNRLIVPQGKSTLLSNPSAAQRILASSGTGLPSSTATSLKSTTQVEVLTIWSNIILTENGAFEKPLGWPTSSDIVGLNVGDAYYEQRRVHTSFMYTSDGKLIEQDFLIKFEKPYIDVFANQLSQVPTSVVLNVDSFNIGNSAGVVSAKLAELGF